MRLLFKITGIFVLLLALSIASVGTYSFLHSKGAMNVIFENRMHSLLNSRAELIEMYLSEKKKSMTGIANDRGIVEMMTGHISDGASYAAHHRESREYLAEKLDTYEDFDEMMILSPEGNVHISTKEDNEGKIFSGEDFFIEGKKRPYAQKSRYDLQMQQFVIFISAPIKSREGRIQGIVAGKLKMQELNNIIGKNRDFSIGEKSYLINEFNYIIAEAGKNSTMPRAVYTDAVKKCLSREEAIGEEYVSEEGSPVISAYKWVDEINACLLTEFDRKKVFIHLTEVKTGVIIAGAAGGLLFALIGFALSRRFTRHISKLRSAAMEISRGKFARIELKTNDELAELADSFNKMSQELEESGKELKKYSKTLARMVEEKTKKLDKKTTALEKSEKAAYNMMEDLNTANKSLEEEKRSIEMKVRERTLDLQKAYEELKALDKAKEEFISMLSHELKTPIFPIMGYTDMLMSGSMGKITEKQKEKLQIVAKNASNLSRLVSDMLDVSKLELKRMKIEPSQEDIGGIAKDAADSLALTGKSKNIEIKLNAPEKIKVNCDRKRILQVMDNLLTNAIKFSKEGGKIEVTVSKEEDNAKVSIKDNGLGISKDDQKQLFSRFFQVRKGISREFGGGTGLGLAISKGIVEIHNGKIWVESELGKGSTFIFTLPLKKNTKSLK